MLLMSKLNDNEAQMAEDNPEPIQKKQPNRRSIIDSEKKIADKIAELDVEVYRLRAEVSRAEGEKAGLESALELLNKESAK